MESRITTAISAAITTLLRPLVRLLLRNGVSYRSFSDIAKRVYVDVATEEFGIPGTETVQVAESVITGLSRKEVLRVKRLPAPSDLGAVERYNRAARVIAGWVRDRMFHDASGRPVDLSVEGDAVCFARLVRTYSGDAPVRAVLDELMRVGVVERASDGRIHLLERSYVPKTGEIDKIAILGVDTSDLVATIDHNICHPDAPFFQRKVSYDNLPGEVLPELKKLAGEQAQTLLEHLDRWMSDRDRDVNPRVPRDGQEAGRGRDLLFPGGLQRRERDMRPKRQTARLLSRVLLLMLASLGLSTCGGAGSDFAGGGTGGTGISSGSITGFGSVVVNGVHFRTDNDVRPGFVTKKMFKGMDMSSRMDKDLLRVGMIVTVATLRTTTMRR